MDQNYFILMFNSLALLGMYKNVFLLKDCKHLHLSFLYFYFVFLLYLCFKN